jgi:RNA polymerase sigma factor (sigma-70 family)
MALTRQLAWPIVAQVGYSMLHDPKSKPAPSELQGNSLLDSLARRYYVPLLSFFRKRTHNASDTQDLVQQVFLRLAQSRQNGEIHNPDAYIFQTAANALRDHHRHLAVRNRHLAQMTTDADTSDLSPERIVLAKEDLARLVDGIRQLPERTRDILILRCFEGLKSPEIARLHRISTRAVEKHIAKALAALSQILDSEGK